MKNINKNTAGISALFIAILFSLNTYGMTDALRIKIGKGSYSDETIIRFLSGATSGFDGSYDAWKMFSSNPSVPNIFSKSSAGDELAINAMPSFTASVTMDVFMKISTADTYTVYAQEPGAFASGVKILMKDLVTNQVYDLRTGSTYTISLPVIAEAAAARFQVFFSYPASTQITNATCSNCGDGQVGVIKAGEAGWQYAITNAAGSTVSSGTAPSSVQTVNGLATGNYTVAISGTFSYSEKRTFSIGVTPVVLGATFIDFTATPGERMVNLLWSTGMESNTDHFTVEHSLDGINYENVENVPAAGNSSTIRTYTASDNNIYGEDSYYRVKLTDLNGTMTYSKVVPVKAQGRSFFSVFPVPASERLNITIEGYKNAEVKVIIRDMMGREVMNVGTIPATDHENFGIDIPGKLSPGVYTITASGNEKTMEKKIIIN